MTSLAIAAVLLAVLPTAAARAAGDDPAAVRAKEQQYIAIITSDAPPKDKAVPCKMLAIYGSARAVPALAPLLEDPQLASWARIALEAIPGPAPDAALRKAAGKLTGRLLIGVINSLGVRRDAEAVELLAAKLKDRDEQVAAAAAEALGRIGTDPAADALTAALADTPPTVRSSVALGCVYCAERCLGAGRADRAMKIYDLVRSASGLPKRRIVEATRGAILARGTAGIDLLVRQLRSKDWDMYAVGLSTAREMPGREVTDALIAEFRSAEPLRKAALLLALADRRDPKVLPVALEAARGGAPDVRLVAVNVLARQGDVSCLPVLLQAACADDAKLAKAARRALAILPGEGVDQAVLERLAKATGRQRQVLIELAGRKQLAAAVPAVMAATTDPNPDVRATAVAVLGGIGGRAQLADIVRAVAAAKDAAAREALEKALIAVTARVGADAVGALEPLTAAGDSALRVVGVHALAAAGGQKALAGVVAATKEKDPAVADEAVRTLSTWPNRWPDDAGVVEPLLTLVRTGRSLTHKVLAARGYLQYLRSTRTLDAKGKLARLHDLMPLLARPEEKRDAVSALRAIRSAESVAVLTELIGSEPAVADEAAAALIDLVSGRRAVRGLPKARRIAALELAAEKAKKPSTRRRAAEALKALR